MVSHRWTLRVRTTDSGAATVVTRKHRFEVGVPASFDEADARVSALEYFFGALGADLVVGLAGLARQRGVRLDHVEALVQGELNDPLAALGVIGAKGHPGIERIHVKLHVSSPDEAATIEALWKDVQAASTLLHSLRATISLELRLDPGL
jgi:hypothetical protein